MKYFTCTEIIKSNNKNLVSYVLQDYTGKEIQISYQKLKLLLESNKIGVVNLALCDNKIIKNNNYEIESLLARIKIFYPGEQKTYKSDCGHNYYVIENPETTIVYIPNDVKYIIKASISDIFNDRYNPAGYNGVKCKVLKVIGGAGLISAVALFEGCEVTSIDLSEFITSKVTNMEYMFYGCKTDKLDLSYFDTSKVINMGHMFDCCTANSIDFSSFNTLKVTNMCSMFSEVSSLSLDLTSFDTSNVTDMSSMFWDCDLYKVDASSFVSTEKTNINKMFKYATGIVIADDKRILAEANNRE